MKSDGDVRPGARYDRIGREYRSYRRPDPRIAAQIDESLGDARSVVDVGSGTGSYEPRDRHVVAVEPSWTMIAQRPPDAAPVVRATAERLPFPTRSFDVALAILTIHHWADPIAGLRELARVAEDQVVLTWDPGVWRSYWLVRDYLPEIPELEADVATLPTVDEVLNVTEVAVVPVPADCTDGFCGAYWRRPEQYLDRGVQGAISGFARLGEAVIVPAMDGLKRDLADGTWERRNGRLRSLDAVDIGYRLVRATGSGAPS